jgi:hypothetical protein
VQIVKLSRIMSILCHCFFCGPVFETSSRSAGCLCLCSFRAWIVHNLFCKPSSRLAMQWVQKPESRKDLVEFQ